MEEGGIQMTYYELYPEGIENCKEFIETLGCHYVAPGINQNSRTYLIISGKLEPHVLKVHFDKIVPITSQELS